MKVPSGRHTALIAKGDQLPVMSEYLVNGRLAPGNGS